MGKKRGLSVAERAKIVTFNEEGYSERQISKKLKFSKTAIHQAIVKFQNFGSFQDLHRSERPRVTSQRDDHLIKRMVVPSPTTSSKKIRSALLLKGTVASTSTIKRRLADNFGLKAYKPAKKPRLTPSMKAKRYAFAKAHQHWTAENWRKALFSDESTVQQLASRKRLMRRPVGTRYEDRYTIQTIKHSPSIMVWGAMSARGTAGLYFLQPGTTMSGAKYLDLLKDKLEIHMVVHDCDVFMHDGAPCHKAKPVKSFLQEKNVDMLDWPGNSPDLNPIENLWHVMKNEVADQQPTGMESLKTTIKIVWTQKISPEYCSNLIDSMPRRMTAVVKNRGGLTKY